MKKRIYSFFILFLFITGSYFLYIKYYSETDLTFCNLHAPADFKAGTPISEIKFNKVNDGYILKSGADCDDIEINKLVLIKDIKNDDILRRHDMNWEARYQN